ncbi:MAG: glycosyltransferase, partial [Chitinophagaceae bacterium]
MNKSSANQQLKKIFLRFFLFRLVDKFMYIGSENKAFYTFHKVPDRKLIFTPYAVDNDRFRNEAIRQLPEKKQLRLSAGLSENDFVIVYSGKYIHKKRPLILLQAYKLLRRPGKALIMIGEGDLRGKMENYISENHLENVILTGFVNQSKISSWYAIADVFVMCSGDGET